MTDAIRLRITLLDLDPEPWRKIEMPLSMTMFDSTRRVPETSSEMRPIE